MNVALGRVPSAVEESRDGDSTAASAPAMIGASPVLSIAGEPPFSTPPGHPVTAVFPIAVPHTNIVAVRGVDGSPAQRILTQGARRLHALGRNELANALAAQALWENDS